MNQKILNGDLVKDVTTHHIPQTQPEIPSSVERTLGIFERQWTDTADACIKRANELDKAAAELRLRAEDLYKARNYLDDVKQSVVFEFECRSRALSLALVNPTE